MTISLAKADFWLSFADIPFALDYARTARMSQGGHAAVTDLNNSPPYDQQPFTDIIDELNRIIPSEYLQDFAMPSAYPGRNLGAIARRERPQQFPTPQVRIGDWYYPTTMSRWSVFRGIATSSAVKAMLLATEGYRQETFVMKAVPSGPRQTRPLVDPFNDGRPYTLETQMFMLPPRPLVELAGRWDGLYLVTLVDERYYFQFPTVSLRVTKDTTWNDLIASCAGVLGVNIGVVDIPAVYTQPEPDSQFWTQEGSAAVLLDSLAYNVGDTIIRLLQPMLGGQYKFVHPLESQTIAKRNRGDGLKIIQGDSEYSRPIIRTAGGHLFQSGTHLPAGDLTKSRNSVLPAAINVTFPKYIINHDPVPHFVNLRTQAQRPSCWYEESYGDMYAVSVFISSGNSVFVTNPIVSDQFPVSGMRGVEVYEHTIRSTAKALISGEANINLPNVNPPLNASGLTALAMQLAADYWNWQASYGLDETYPGTYNWTPEGYHDIIWTYSERARGAFTRVMRTQWNQVVGEMQHATPALSGFTHVVDGVGGPSVAQTWRNRESGTSIRSVLKVGMTATDLSAVFSAIHNFPTQNRFRAYIDGETILFEATSGGIAQSDGYRVDVVYRGIDGTLPAIHLADAGVTQLLPNINYGTNLVTYEKMQFLYPAEWTSGGIQGVNLVPQTQSVQAVGGGSGTLINGVMHVSGTVKRYDPTFDVLSNQFRTEENVWLVERNAKQITAGNRYDGQFAGYSASFNSGNISGQGTAPVYLVSIGDGGSTGLNFSGGCFRFLNNVSGSVTCIDGVVTLTLIKDERYYWPLSGSVTTSPCLEPM